MVEVSATHYLPNVNFGFIQRTLLVTIAPLKYYIYMCVLYIYINIYAISAPKSHPLEHRTVRINSKLALP